MHSTTETGLPLFTNTDLEFVFNLIYRVSHHIRSSIGLNYDFRDKSENLRRMNHFEKLNKANIRILLWKMRGFSYIMGLFWR